jgi:hypothetical protein
MKSAARLTDNENMENGLYEQFQAISPSYRSKDEAHAAFLRELEGFAAAQSTTIEKLVIAADEAPWSEQKQRILHLANLLSATLSH